VQDKGGLATALASGVYAEPALIPPSPWLDKKAPAKPKLKVSEDGKLSWKPGNFDKVTTWLLQTKIGNQWHLNILTGDAHDEVLSASPDIVALTAIDRCGVAGPPTVFERSSSPKK
jgi:hypothetical protein